jgi:pyruvate dehydrogenase E1 component beta subunit
MRRDKSVVLMGTDVINQCGAFSTYLGVTDEFPDRVFDMPICELGFSHFGTGAAMIGLRPVVEIGFSDFATLASDCIINTAAKYRFSTLGERSLPIVYAMGNGSRGVYGGWSTGCNHDQCTETMFQNTAGLKILAPFYPGDAKALLKAAIRDNDPVVFYYHLASGGMRGEVSEDPDFIIPLTPNLFHRTDCRFHQFSNLFF